jgi:hypothetical protein
MQMIMQCSLPSLRTLHNSAQENISNSLANAFTSSVLDSLNRIQSAQLSSRICTLEERIALVAIAKEFQKEEALIRKEMDQTRAIRRRQSKNKEKLDPLPGKGETTRTRALKKLLHQSPSLKNTKLFQDRLNTFIQEGKTLGFICGALGPNTLAMLPGNPIRPCDIQLKFPRATSCFTSLSEPIEPIK